MHNVELIDCPKQSIQPRLGNQWRNTQRPRAPCGQAQSLGNRLSRKPQVGFWCNPRWQNSGRNDVDACGIHAHRLAVPAHTIRYGNHAIGSSQEPAGQCTPWPQCQMTHHARTWQQSSHTTHKPRLRTPPRMDDGRVDPLDQLQELRGGCTIHPRATPDWIDRKARLRQPYGNVPRARRDSHVHIPLGCAESCRKEFQLPASANWVQASAHHQN